MQPRFSLQVQQSPKSPNFLSPEDGVSAAVESYNPRGSASFIEQRQAAKECKFGEVTLSFALQCIIQFKLGTGEEESECQVEYLLFRLL